MLDYRGKLILAPMVRISELPIRLLSLRHGADFVYGPEIVDKKLVQCKRVWNEKIQCVDFIEKDNKLVFRTYPKEEKKKLIFQLGTASPELAVEAAKVVANDVDEIGVNSGCPKHFSIHSGMGAALLRTPDVLESILKALVKEVGEPFNIPISVKIRVLEDRQATYDLVRRIAKTGIRCVSVHCRTTRMRPREPVIRDYLAGIADICHEAGISCVVNGDIKGRYELQNLMEMYNVDGAMIARSAETNTSCFSSAEPGPSGLVNWRIMIQEYFKICKQFENCFSNTKYCILQMVPGKENMYQILSKVKSMDELERILQEDLESNASIVSPSTAWPTPITFKRQREDSINDSPRKVQVAVNAA